MEHRFRPIKKHMQAVRQAVSQDRDAKDLSDMVTKGDKGTAEERRFAERLADNVLSPTDIAKYYGESTPGGIEFQFRGVKKEAKAARDAVAKGQSPLSARKPTAASAATTPTTTTPQSGAKRKAGSAVTTPRTRTPGAKRFKTDTAPAGLGFYDAEGDDDDEDLPALDATPSHRPRAALPPPPPPPTMPTPSASLEATPSEDGDDGDYSFVNPSSSQDVAVPVSGGFFEGSSWAKDEDFSGLTDVRPPSFGDQTYSFQDEV